MSTSVMPFSALAHGLEITGVVPAIDHHSHAAYVRPGERLETFDALETEVVAGYVESRIPADAYQQFVRSTRAGDRESAARVATQHGIPELREAARDLYRTTAFARALSLGTDVLYGAKPREQQIETARVRLDDYRGLYDEALAVSSTRMVLTDVPELDPRAWPADRYRQIARIDPYLYPFGHDPYVGRGFDAQRFAAILSEKLVVELGQDGRDAPHDTLDDYREFVVRSLRRRVADGVVGFKIVSAYLRTLNFAAVDVADARAAYDALRSAPADSAHPIARKELSDYLVGVIAHLAVTLDLPVQIHSGIGHSEPGLRIANANPLLLEEFLNTPSLNRLRVVLIHGGYPYASQLGALAHSLGNVYLDYSWMPYLHSHLTVRVLQEWLEFLPAHKVAYGTDTAHPEIHVGATLLAREALEVVLQQGLAARIWSAAQASMLAERVLGGNVAELYGIAR
ncbi:amidohydrolase family protein [Microbacterium sp. W4I20]|uniref:amidohydrolase family protein n=1 Tax=Microbacterium sp. W4I20 TaxID=3042262 RepID=UPI0027829017|nr:amidohydrolase family protein [Microbacterium sp. W4I20]MDQ0727658.1 putative TIM-barrel fold metal-dependent hydrolase [Microbacterium sp. W4I20]